MFSMIDPRSVVYSPARIGTCVFQVESYQVLDMTNMTNISFPTFIFPSTVNTTVIYSHNKRYTHMHKHVTENPADEAN